MKTRPKHQTKKQRVLNYFLFCKVQKLHNIFKAELLNLNLN